MQVVMDRGLIGTKRYDYAVDDVRDGRTHRTLLRRTWARDVPTMADLQTLVKECGAVLLEPDWETDAHLRGTVPCGGIVASVRGIPLRTRGIIVAVGVLTPIIIEIVDRLNIIPGF